jgi:hypothetical protein
MLALQQKRIFRWLLLEDPFLTLNPPCSLPHHAAGYFYFLLCTNFGHTFHIGWHVRPPILPHNDQGHT